MLKVYNTLSKEKEIMEPFDSAQGKKVNLFVCGITPYDSSHIGHARTYIVFDVIVKYLRSIGYKVYYLQNITDVDDKIIKRAQELNETPKALAQRFEKEFLKDMKELRVDSVTKYARATEHIKEIIHQVKRLFDKGFAYEIENDGIYFDISKFKDYGKLSGRTSEQTKDAVSRIDESVRKRNKGDFALWKMSKPEEPKWSFDSSLRSSLRTGRPASGRPGWHIEDTAISEKYFGEQYDMHGGGIDLIFPHHEAEVTQMEALSGRRPFVKYWLHTGFLTIHGEKMSKSLGNFITIHDFIKTYSPRVLRFLFLKSHYRSPLDYSESLVDQTKLELERIDECVSRLCEVRLRASQAFPFPIAAFQKRFHNAMEDDFNTAEAVGVLFDLIREANSLMAKHALGKQEKKHTLDFLKHIDKIFDVIFWKREKNIVPLSILDLMKQREEYRKNKEWEKADQTRREIEAKGWFLEDTAKGPEAKFAKKNQ